MNLFAFRRNPTGIYKNPLGILQESTIALKNPKGIYKNPRVILQESAGMLLEPFWSLQGCFTNLVEIYENLIGNL